MFHQPQSTPEGKIKGRSIAPVCEITVHSDDGCSEMDAVVRGKQISRQHKNRAGQWLRLAFAG